MIERTASTARSGHRWRLSHTARARAQAPTALPAWQDRFSTDVIAVLVWAWFRYFTGDGKYAKRLPSRAARLTITILLAVAVVIVVIGAVYTVIVIGESGAKAVWDSRIG